MAVKEKALTILLAIDTQGFAILLCLHYCHMFLLCLCIKAFINKLV